MRRVMGLGMEVDWGVRRVGEGERLIREKGLGGSWIAGWGGFVKGDLVGLGEGHGFGNGEMLGERWTGTGDGVGR